jgi:hypothetical protein
MVFEVPSDDDVEIELVVRRKRSADTTVAADTNAASVDEAAAPGNYVVLKRTSEDVSSRAENAKFAWSPNGTAKLILPGQDCDESSPAPVRFPAVNSIPAQSFLSSTCPSTWDIKWNRHYTALVKFQRDNGHCRVPHRCGDYPRLADWILLQRKSFKDGTLSRERMEKLTRIGLSWDPWTEKYNALVQYKRKYGDCNVSSKDKEHHKLGTWVGDLRTSFKKGTLSDARISKLNEIGFTWHGIDAKWNMRYSELMKYIREFGHCNVPQKYDANPQLGEWVITQRKTFKNGSIREDRLAKLNELGFRWNTK